MTSDRGVAPSLRPDELEAAWFEGCTWLHVPGYSLLGEPITSTAAAAVELARGAGARVSVDLSSARTLAEQPNRFRTLLERLSPDLIFANEQERQAIGELPAPACVVKRGAAGACFVRGRERLELRADPGEAIDSTGAGDALAAGFLLGGSLEDAARRGLAAAARCLAKLGAMP